MDHANLLVIAMVEECEDRIRKSNRNEPNLPRALHPRHLLWMCERIEKHADEWLATKIHRWIGFIQCGMLANQMLDLRDTKAMFDQVKDAHEDIGEDDDLIDHLNPENSFDFDLGGEG